MADETSSSNSPDTITSPSTTTSTGTIVTGAATSGFPYNRTGVPTSSEVKVQKRSQPVRVDGTNRRSDADVLEGSFVRVVDGPHAGQVASFDKVIERDSHGYPARVLIRFRDHNYTHPHSVEEYSNLRPAHPYAGGR